MKTKSQKGHKNDSRKGWRRNAIEDGEFDPEWERRDDAIRLGIALIELLRGINEPYDGAFLTQQAEGGDQPTSDQDPISGTADELLAKLERILANQELGILSIDLDSDDGEIDRYRKSIAKGLALCAIAELRQGWEESPPSTEPISRAVELGISYEDLGITVEEVADLPRAFWAARIIFFYRGFLDDQASSADVCTEVLRAEKAGFTLAQLNLNPEEIDLDWLEEQLCPQPPVTVN